MRRTALSGLLCVLVCAAGCDSPKPAPPPPEKRGIAEEPPPAVTASPKPATPPDISVSEGTVKIGSDYVLLDKPEGMPKLANEMTTNKDFFAGKDVAVAADRAAKVSAVAALMRALEGAGATGVVVTTESRPQFPKALKFAPLGEGKAAAKCSLVTKVLAEHRNAVWSLQGGTAVKSPKGLAGPDLSITGDMLDAAAARCKASDTVFVSADDKIQWGLVYDLAGASETLEKAKFAKVILLDPAPTAGHAVSL